MGIRLDKVMSDTYRVVAECLPLWEQEKRKMNIPVFSYELLDKKKLQFFIEYEQHGFLFAEAVECARKQFGSILKERIEVDDLFLLIENLSSAFASKHNPVDWTRLFEFKLALALYLDDVALGCAIKKEIEKEVKYWNKDRFHALFLQSVEEWKSGLYQKMGDREQFMKQLELNKGDKKILKLKEAHFVDKK